MMNLRHAVRRSLFRNSRGSSAIILSVMVSGSVLATIFYNQQSMQWALSAQTNIKVQWSDHFIKKYGITLGSYLVANNLVLCKQGGWGDAPNLGPLCKWNDGLTEPDQGTPNQVAGIKPPEDFHLIPQENSALLQYKARIKEANINNGREVKFSLSFDLVNWKDTAIKSLIGEIPSYVCRDTQTKQIRDGYCSPPTTSSFQKKCKYSSANDAESISNSQCEYMAEVDQDYYIVLLQVRLLEDDGTPRGEMAYAGIRRPLTSILVEMNEQPKCSLACVSSLTSNNNPGCRGDFQPYQGELAKLKLKITNKGPGVLYHLSLLRKEEPIPRSETSETKYTILANALTSTSKKYLLPGENITIFDQVKCSESVHYKTETITRIQTQSQWRTNPITAPQTESSQTTVNVHAQPYMTLSYILGSLKQAKYFCIESDDQGWRKNKGSCLANQEGNSCSVGGICMKAKIEPSRSLFQGSINVDQVTTTFTTVVRVVYPH